MNILKHFRRETTVETTTDDVLDELEAEQIRQRQIQAQQIVRERQSTEEYRVRNAKTLADFLRRKDANTQEVNAHVAALLLVLTDTRKLVIESANIPFDGRWQNTEQVFAFPVDFPDKIIAAIYEAAPRTQWDFSGKPGQPKEKEPLKIREPRFAGDRAPPPGFSGMWDLVKGEPIE